MSYEYKDELKSLLPVYLEMLEDEGKTRARGDGYYDCPFCGSGTGVKGTPAFHLIGNSYNCFSCNEQGDIFDLVAYMEGLSDKWPQHYRRTLQIMEPYLDEKPKTDGRKSRDKPDVSDKIDYSTYLEQCHKDVYKTSYFNDRGLSDRIIDKFHLGFDGKKNVITIPFNKDYTGYVHRILFKGDNIYIKFGNGLFNVAALYTYGTDAYTRNDQYVFITEGQIDAMSFEEIGYNAVGLGGTNNIEKLIEQLKLRQTEKTLVLAMDNDIPGKKATGRIIVALAESGLNTDYIVVSNLYGRYKDANEFLVANRVGFCERVSNIAEMTMR